ncbi:MAG: hypothetical protein A3K19_26585 [Lentisphaerae bacterium RIFOXYB12_FULL_65_16]|nr:MAG: hypothetical protein A3K18_18260 [Lentisphaerae bacterium RIFOXYA12_64_32]OGV86342.1 MAG: hypothetical protein A3K19_26585 [Lentisphaerae bacterium RIFOXYB12_FULL_65_16]
MYTVGVIGLGSIAAFYGKPDTPAPYCHVGGIRLSKKVKLAAVADLAADRHEKFRQEWGCCFPDAAYYDSAAAMLAAQKLDIVAICNRGPHHYETIMSVLDTPPRAIFLEKPPSCSLDEMDRMAAKAKSKQVPITVSYSRHWCPHVLRLQELVQAGQIGKVEMVVAYTGNVFLSFASHVTDLICQFAGYCPTAIYARGTPGKEVPAGFEPEPLLGSAIIEFANGVTATHVGRNGEHGGFYVDVFGTEGRVRAGIYTKPFVADKDNKPVDLEKLGFPPNDSVFRVAYDQIADHLGGGPLPHCTDADFIAVNELGFGGIESVITGQRVALPNTNRARKIFANG